MRKHLKALAKALFSQNLRSIEAFIDKDYYLKNNHDVARANMSPVQHFLHHGWVEGRNPSASFNTMYYRDTYLSGSAVNPLVDYIQRGGRKRRLKTIPLTLADSVKLQSQVIFNSGIAQAMLAQPITEEHLEDYLRDWKSRQAPLMTFDPQAYVKENEYVETLGICPLYHFASQTRLKSALKHSALVQARPESPAGKLIGPDASNNPDTNAKRCSKLNASEEKGPQEVRFADLMRLDSFTEKVIAKEFDADFYLATNHDVARAGKDPLKHFCQYGWLEGRMPTSWFDCTFYLKSYSEKVAKGINPFFHFLTVGRQLNLRPHPAGLKLYNLMNLPDEDEWDAALAANDAVSPDCVIIMPVYKGRAEVLQAILSVLMSVQNCKYLLHVVDDYSPDPQLSADLLRLSQRGFFRLERNNSNLGFVATVNNALRAYSCFPVILLNTDTKVFGNWIDRILRHAREDEHIATITPLSNNATIFSYPRPNINNQVEMELSAQGLDSLAADCNFGRISDVPTGVGFCFFMSVKCREVIGLFDEERFGRGYGEENDFCLRASKAGFRNVMSEDVFVYHVGEVSFGRPDRVLPPPGQQALTLKHPEYLDNVKQYLTNNLADQGRIRLDLARLARFFRGNAVVLVHHALKGGVITHIRDEEAAFLRKGINVIHVRVGVGSRWGVEVKCDLPDSPYCPNLQPMAYAKIEPHLKDFFKWLQPKFTHVHSFVGLDWHATSDLMKLIATGSTPYKFTLHDYSVVCHRNDLVTPMNTFCGLPDTVHCRLCVSNDRSYPEAVDPAVRRQAYHEFLLGAEEVIAPSRDIAHRLTTAGAKYRVNVQAHCDIESTQERVHRIDTNGCVQIAIIGAIGPHKGSRVLLGLAKDVVARQLPICYHIVGYSDISDELAAAGVIETGPYASHREAIVKLQRTHAACVFLPSIWPETFSYTLSIAFATSCLPVVFDIGAPAERIRDKQFGHCLPYDFIHHLPDLNDELYSLLR